MLHNLITFTEMYFYEKKYTKMEGTIKAHTVTTGKSITDYWVSGIICDIFLFVYGHLTTP